MNKKITLIFILIGFIASMTTVTAHEGMENPIIDFDTPKNNEEVSGDVDFKFTIHEHNEVKEVNVIAEHRETKTKYFDKTDNNPSDGWSVTWDTSNAPNGKYWITTTARDVKGLEGKSEREIILNNLPKKTTITSEAQNAIVNKPTNIVAYLKDNDSNPISGKSLNFIINGETISSTTNGEGLSTITFTPSEAKNYDLLIKFGGDYRYLESQTNTILKTLTNTTSLTINDIKANNNDNIILKANLANLDLDVSNKKIDFYINGKSIGSNYTNINGDAILHYLVAERGGKHLYQVKYQNESGDNFTSSATLHVPQSELYMQLNAVTYSNDGIFTVGDFFKLNYIINNNGPDTAENTIVKYLMPSNLKYITSTPSKGSLTIGSGGLEWNIGDLPVGSQQLELTFQVLSSGRINLSPTITTSTYDESVTNGVPTRVLTVNNYNLKSSNLVKYYGGSDKYRVYLYDSNGNIVSGANIKIQINKQSFNLKTNNQGFVELGVNLKAGTYNIKATCNKLSITNKITIKPTLITKDISKKKAKKVKFTAKLLNNKGKIVKNKKIVFLLKGKKYTAKTNKKGVATLVLKNLKVGKYIIKTSYGKLSVKNTIKIKK